MGIEAFGYVRELGGIAAPPLSLDPAVRDSVRVFDGAKIGPLDDGPRSRPYG